MRNIALTILAFVFLSCGFANAASPQDVAEVAAMVTDKKVPMLLRVSSSMGGQHMGDTITFVHKGMRYTIYNSGELINPNKPESAWLAFWVRKDGTSSQETMDTFSDNAFDGTVDFGIDGPRKYEFDLGTYGSSARGVEHQVFWQKKYDAAIKATLEYKRSRVK